MSKTHLFGTSTPMGEEQRNESLGITREIPLQAIATPGLTPIERGPRDGDDDDGDEVIDDDDEEADEHLFLFGKSTEKRGGGREDRLLGVEEHGEEDGDEEDELSVDLRHVPHPKDEVRRRVSFGPMLEEKFEGTRRPMLVVPPSSAHREFCQWRKWWLRYSHWWEQ
jgi:hypothetical protein